MSAFIFSMLNNDSMRVIGDIHKYVNYPWSKDSYLFMSRIFPLNFKSG